MNWYPSLTRSPCALATYRTRLTDVTVPRGPRCTGLVIVGVMTLLSRWRYTQTMMVPLSTSIGSRRSRMGLSW